MFDFVRKHNRIMQVMLFLLVVPSFLLFGIEGYSRFRDKGESVAEIAGQEISTTEWDAAHKQEIERQRAANPKLDIKLLDSPQARYATLERMVRERVMEVAAESSGLVTGDLRLKHFLERDPGIAAMRMPDGTLDRAKYQQLAAQQGLTPAGLESKVRADLSARQVSSGLLATGLSTAVVADLALDTFLERREVQLARFNPVEFGNKVTPSQAEIEAYYKDNQGKFQSIEQASVEYVVLDLDVVKKSIVLNEADLKTYYEQNKERMGRKEERRASHILIEAAKAASPEQRLKAKAKAEELLVAVKKAPESFAELAKKNSQDPGSASNGGDLPFFVRGAMVKPFEDAAFAMKKGDISGVVESDFGYHIIKLTDIKPSVSPGFDEVRTQMEADLKKQQAQRKFAEVADVFTNTVYEQADSFKPVAEKLKLEVHTATGITRQPTASTVPALVNAKLLGLLFAADSIEKKRNTEAVEVNTNQLVSARIVQYTAARTLPLAEVADLVKGRLQATQGAELARKEGKEKLAAWQGNPALGTFAAPVVLSRDQSQGQPSSVLEAALRAAPEKLPALVGVDLESQGYAIVKVNKLVPRADEGEAVRKSQRQQFSQVWTNAEFLAYYELLKEKLKVKITAPRPSANAAGDAAAATGG